ncbi:MAG: putative integral rane protein [Gemmatimonadetes bacterium]|nr:putative integral rane protein [Gemmatimonadota bacterium]
MVQDTHDKLRPMLQRRDHGFRWRGKEISRIEGLSDAVFAFAVTLLVVSLEAPKRFEDLLRMMHGFVSFGVCFAILLLIWHSQYIYFRRYALDDNVSFLLNAMLLFVVSFYVYPLKFLFTAFVNGVTGYQDVDAAGKAIVAMQPGDWRRLMFIYSAGFIGVYAIFAALYAHAYRLREYLDLTPMEVYETRGVVQEHLLMMGIGVLSVILSMAGLPQFAGMAYVLIGPMQTILGTVHGRGRRRLGYDP